jgi:hypothetical protein
LLVGVTGQIEQRFELHLGGESLGVGEHGGVEVAAVGDHDAAGVEEVV